MKKFFEKYFVDKEGNPVALNLPANEEQIVKCQKQLDVVFPQDYVEFLLHSNGCGEFAGQTMGYLNGIEFIAQESKDQRKDYFPWIVFIGSDGGNEMYILDNRNNPATFAILPFIGAEEDYIPMGKTFEEFLEHVFQNDFWPVNKTTEK